MWFFSGELVLFPLLGFHEPDVAAQLPAGITILSRATPISRMLTCTAPSEFSMGADADRNDPAAIVEDRREGEDDGAAGVAVVGRRLAVAGDV